MRWKVTCGNAPLAFALALLMAPSAQAMNEESGAAGTQAAAASVSPDARSNQEEMNTQNPIFGEMLQLHNNARSRYNLRPMRMNRKLNRAAQRFAEFMGRTRSFGHYADGRSPAARMSAEGYGHTSWAENIAWVGSRPTDAMNTWMNSGGHRANILSDHGEVGFGLYNGVWVAVFGNPSAREVEMIGGE